MYELIKISEHDYYINMPVKVGVVKVSDDEVIIIDSGNDMSGLKYLEDLKTQTNFTNTKIIVTTTVHDKTKILNAGADLYLPKPYEISDLVKWVEYFINNS